MAGSNNTLIGNGADTGVDASNSIIIGNSLVNALSINGTKTGNNPLLFLPQVVPPTASGFGSATHVLPVSVNGVTYYLALYNSYS